MFKKAISLILSVSLILTQPVFAQGVAELNIGKYLSQMPIVKTDSFRPARLRYISYDIASNDFKLLLDQGDAKLSNSLTPKLQDATQELFNYFLIGLSLTNEKFWVNLRPDAPEQIIDPLLEKTDMGKIMLEADLQLKKDTASLTSPQNPEGREYWDKLYKKAGELFGTENITIPTITRPWIVPGEVIIRESEDSAYIYKANLKVMLEEDYLTGRGGSRTAPTHQQYTFSDPRMKELNKYSTQLIKELILPRLTQEINTSNKYAQLRQVFFSLILSRWFKDKYKGSPGQYSSLIDSSKLDNLNSKESWNKEYYFNEYKKSFQQGEYNLKEQVSTPTGQVIRSYVSGGIEMKESNKEGSFFSENGNTSWTMLITMGVISVISALYIANNMGYRHNTHISHYDISNIIYQIEPIPDKLNIENINNIFREIIKVNSTNTYNKIHNLNSQIKFKDSFYGYILKYYVDKGSFWTTRGSIREGIMPSLGNAIRMLNAANKFIVNNPDAAIYAFLKYPSSLKDDEKLLEALHIVRIDINNAKETFELLSAKIGKQWVYALSNVVRAEGVESLKRDISYLLDDLMVNSEYVYDPNNKGDVGLKAILDGIVYDFKIRKLVSGDTLKAFITEADQLINKALGEPIKRSFLGELVSGYMSDVKKILSALDSKKPKGSSPLAPQEGASSAIVLEDEFKEVKDYAFNKFKSLEESLMLPKKGTAFERLMAARPNLRLKGGPFTGNIGQSKDFPGLMMSIESALQSAPNLFPGQVNLKQLGEIRQDLVNVIKPIGIQLQLELFEYINEYVSKNPATASKLNRILQMIRSEESMFGILPAERSEVILEFTTDMIAFTDKQKAQDFSAKVDAWKVLSNFVLSSSALTQDLPQNNSAPLTTGGIDFTQINYLTRPMGSFQGLDLRLPLLSRAELDGIDISRELAAVEQMINAKIDVSTDRLKRLLAAMSQKDVFTSQREIQLLPLLLRLCWLKEEKGAETTPDFRAVLLIADTGLFVEQGNTKYSLN